MSLDPSLRLRTTACRIAEAAGDASERARCLVWALERFAAYARHCARDSDVSGAEALARAADEVSLHMVAVGAELDAAGRALHSLPVALEQPCPRL
jgi:hypothetical protein